MKKHTPDDPCCEDCRGKDISCKDGDTKCWEGVLQMVEDIKATERERHTKLVDSATKVRAAVEDFLNEGKK